MSESGESVKYILQIAQTGGYRPYGMQEVEIKIVNGTKPTIDSCYKGALAVVPPVAHAIMRRAIYMWAFSNVCEKGGIGIEIGVDYGDGLDLLLEQNEPSLVMGVDPWLSFEWDPWFKQPQEQMDARYKLVCERFKNDERVQIIRSTSDDFFAKLDTAVTGFADFVHVDGDHREEPACRDIIGAYHALRVGGILIIDDVHLKSWTGTVKPAVDRAIAALGSDVLEVVHDSTDPVIYRKVK